MAITEVSAKISLKLTAIKIDSTSCGLQTVSIWMPVAPTVTSLPPAPPVVVNSNPAPAYSAPLPANFDYDNANLCQIFDDILVNTQETPVYANELTVETLILPYNEIVTYLGRLRVPLNLYRYNYTVKPIIQSASPTLKFKATGVRLYKFKCEKMQLSLSGKDARVYANRFIRAASTSFTSTYGEGIFKPIKLIADKASYTTVFSNGRIGVPGTFSYGWTSIDISTINAPSPINIASRRNIHQSLYLPSILLSNGAKPDAAFKNLRWYVGSAISPANSIRGMNIKIFHTSATNASSALNPITGETKTVVYSSADTEPFLQAESVGVLQINFITPFIWNGVNAIVVESCTAQNETGFAYEGTMRTVTYSTVRVRRHEGSDFTGTSCNTTPVNSYFNNIAIQMDFT